jgi:hypothetical protein
MGKSFRPMPPPITSQAEWLSCRDPYAMLNCVEDKFSDRKYRLFACGCLRLVEGEGTTGEPFLGLAERVADGKVTAEESEQARELGTHFWHQNYAAWALVPTAWQGVVQIRSVTADNLRRRLSKTERRKHRAHESPEQVLLFRCVFGNPFRPVTFAPTWLTSTVVTLASQMYESREFGPMPILADALQDAGCDDEDVLGHCRETKTRHVRGCWVVDSILGKS